MEFMNRGGQSRLNSNSSAPAPAAPKSPTSPSGLLGADASAGGRTGLFKWSFLVLLFSTTALVIATLFFIVVGGTGARENKLVNSKEYQAVFVNVNGTNGGQVYFGHVQALTPQFIRLTNVFYIQNQQSSQNQSSSAYNLVKLGCELHGPEDQMVINRSEVFFWENLKSDSQVAQKAAEFYKQNPNGQKCSANSSSTQQSSGTTNEAPATVAPTTGGTTTPTTAPTPAPTTTKKP
jgi:hypothetical protein